MLDGVVARAAARGRALAPHPTPLAKLMTPMINLDRPIKADRIQTVPISYLFLQRVLASRIAMLLLTIDRTQEQPLPFFPLRISYLRILTYSRNRLSFREIHVQQNLGRQLGEMTN